MAAEIRNSREAYTAILGLRGFPEAPNYLPDKFFLPAPCWGDMIDAVGNTFEDGRERAQHIHWNRGRQRFDKGPLIRGTQEYVLAKDRRFSKLRDRPVVSYHTHPGDGIPRHSERDIVLDVFRPSGYISMVASEHGVSGLLSTCASEISKGIFFRNTRFRLLKRALDRSQAIFSPYQMFRARIESLGFGYYCANLGTLTSEDLSQGITLYKNMGVASWEFDA